MNVKALIVKASGEVEVQELDLKPDMAGLRTLQNIVEGPIEAITGGFWNAYCNEEGKLLGLPINKVATELALYTGWNKGVAVDVLCGTVVFFGHITVTESEDIHEDVPQSLIDLARAIAAEL